MTRMSKWIPTTNLMELRRLGKLGEELGELSNVASRCIIQGLDETDPGSGKVNRQRLQDELADVQAQIGCTVLAFGLDQDYMARRTAEKMRQMAEWEAMFATDGVRAKHEWFAQPVPGIGVAEVCQHCGTIRRRRSKSVPWSYWTPAKEPLSTQPECDRGVDAARGLSGEAWSAVTKRCFDTGGNAACADVLLSRCALCPNRKDASGVIGSAGQGNSHHTPIESKDEWHKRLGWLICAYDVLIAVRMEVKDPK
jgi:NTP pyrophosphatase (non-canonical NTP hydrolase)